MIVLLIKSCQEVLEDISYETKTNEFIRYREQGIYSRKHSNISTGNKGIKDKSIITIPRVCRQSWPHKGAEHRTNGAVHATNAIILNAFVI